MMTMPNRADNPSRFLAALRAGSIAVVVATGIGLVVAELLGVGLVSTLAVWATVGIVSVRLYARFMGRPIRWGVSRRG